MRRKKNENKIWKMIFSHEHRHFIMREWNLLNKNFPQASQMPEKLFYSRFELSINIFFVIYMNFFIMSKNCCIFFVMPMKFFISIWKFWKTCKKFYIFHSSFTLHRTLDACLSLWLYIASIKYCLGTSK